MSRCWPRKNGEANFSPFRLLGAFVNSIVKTDHVQPAKLNTDRSHEITVVSTSVHEVP